MNLPPPTLWRGTNTQRGGVETKAETNREREFSIENLLVRIHFIIAMIRWTGLALWEFEIHLSR
jgi:hypothetical protein